MRVWAARFSRLGASLALAAWLVPGAGAGSGSGASSRLVVSADRAPALSGEIFRVDLDGRRTDLSRSPFQDTQPVVSPDGAQVAFVSDRTGETAVYVVGIDGRGLERVSGALAQPTIVGWSRDSRRVLVTAMSPGIVGGDGLLEVVGAGAPPRVIANDRATLREPSWSPDGRFVAYVSGGDRVRVVTPAGAAVFEVDGASNPTTYAWSAADRIAVLSQALAVGATAGLAGGGPGGAGETIQVDDERGRRLARFAGLAPTWSPSGALLASMDGGVLEVRGGGGTGPVVLRRRLFPASEVREIVAAMRVYDPALLWDGERRVAVGNVSRTSELVGPLGPEPGMTVDTGVDLASRRTWRPTGRQWYAGSCGCESPDGSLVAFTANRGSGFALRVSKPGGSAARTIAPLPGCSDDGAFVAAVSGLQFANRGRSVVYQSVCGEPPANLFSLTGSGGVERLTATRAQQTAPALSPDGGMIAYVQAPATGLSCQGCPTALWVMDADGSHTRRLTAPEQQVWDAAPSWSPDGARIVFSRSTQASFGELYVIPAAGGKARDLHIAGADPAWGPHAIAYLGGEEIGGPHISLWTVAPDGAGRRKLATGYLGSPAWSRTGRLAYLVQPPAGAPALVVIDGKATHRYPLPFSEASGLAWSPDGTRLVIVARALSTAPYDAYSLDADGRDLRRLTTNLDVLGATWAR